MRSIAAVAVLGWFGVAHAEDDPFAMLRERDREWTFELTAGASLAALAPVKGAPHTRCRVADTTPVGAVPRSVIACAPIGAVVGEVPALLTQRFYLVFEPAGVREVVFGPDDPAQLAERTNAGAFTFPRVLDRRWRYDVERPGGAHVVVAVHDELTAVHGAKTALWVAESTTQSGAAGEPVTAATTFAPGVGPVLRCTITRSKRKPTYACLRRIDDPPAGDPAPPKPRPVAVVRVASKTAHDKSSLSAATVAARLSSSYLPAIRRCYEERLRDKPAAGGSLVLEFTVNAVGKLTDPTATIADDTLAGCVRSTMTSWRFPIPQSEYSEPRNARFTIGLRLAPP